MAQCHGNARIRGNGDGRRHPGHDLVMEACSCESRSFLSPASKNEGITTLETNDCQTLFGLFDEQCVDVVLRHHRSTRRFRHADSLRSRRGQIEQCAHRKPVVNHNIGHRQGLCATKRQQSRIARPSSDEKHSHRLSLGGSPAPRPLGPLMPKVTARERRFSEEEEIFSTKFGYTS